MQFLQLSQEAHKSFFYYRYVTNLIEKQAKEIAQGRAYTDALHLLTKITDTAKTVESEDYIITFASESAEGLYQMEPGGDLQWQIPKAHYNQHLEVAVQDRIDERFVPELDVQISLKSIDGNEVISQHLPFLWHPIVYHYGKDVVIPEEGNYRITVTVMPAKFGRHDENKGKRYGSAAVAEFGTLHLKPSVKEYGPE